MMGTVDIDEALGDHKVNAVLNVWFEANSFEAPAFSGGVVDAWPALMVDGLAICQSEERAICDYVNWFEREGSRG